MLMPKRVKYRRPHRVSYEGKAKGGTELAFGEYGLKSLEGAYLTNRQIEAAYRYYSLYESSRTSMD